MKKLFIILLSIGLVSGAFAQRGHFGGGYHYYSRPQVIVGFGAYAPIYPFYGFGYYPFGYPYGYPYPPGYGYYRPSKLTLQIEDIKNDYRDKIVSVKNDKNLTHTEKRQKIHELKQQRDKEIDDTKSNYYKH